MPAPYYLAGRGWGDISSSDGRADTLRVSVATAPLTTNHNINRCAYLKPAATAAKEPLEPLPGRKCAKTTVRLRSTRPRGGGEREAAAAARTGDWQKAGQRGSIPTVPTCRPALDETVKKNGN